MKQAGQVVRAHHPHQLGRLGPERKGQAQGIVAGLAGGLGRQPRQVALEDVAPAHLVGHQHLVPAVTVDLGGELVRPVQQPIRGRAVAGVVLQLRQPEPGRDEHRVHGQGLAVQSLRPGRVRLHQVQLLAVPGEHARVALVGDLRVGHLAVAVLALQQEAQAQVPGRERDQHQHAGQPQRPDVSDTEGHGPVQLLRSLPYS